MIVKLLRVGGRKFQALSRLASNGNSSNGDTKSHLEMPKHSSEGHKLNTGLDSQQNQDTPIETDRIGNPVTHRKSNSPFLSKEEIEADVKRLTASDSLDHYETIIENYFSRENDLDLKALVEGVLKQSPRKTDLIPIAVKLILKLSDIRRSKAVFPQSIGSIFMLSKQFVPQPGEQIASAYLKLSVHLIYFLNRFFADSHEVLLLFDGLASLDWSQMNYLQMSTFFYVFLTNPAISSRRIVSQNPANLAYVTSKINQFIKPDMKVAESINEIQDEQVGLVISPKFKTFIQAQTAEDINKASVITSQLVSMIYALTKSTELLFPLIDAFKGLIQKETALIRLNADELCICLYILHKHPQLDPDNRLTFTIYAKILKFREILQEDSLFVSFLSLRRFAEVMMYTRNSDSKEAKSAPKQSSQISNEQAEIVSKYYRLCWKTYCGTYRTFSFQTNIKILYEVSHQLKMLILREFLDLRLDEYFWQRLEEEGNKISFYDLLTFGYIMKRYLYIDSRATKGWEMYIFLLSKHMKGNIQARQRNRVIQIIDNTMDLTRMKGLETQRNRALYNLLNEFQEKYLKNN